MAVGPARRALRGDPAPGAGRFERVEETGDCAGLVPGGEPASPAGLDRLAPPTAAAACAGGLTDGTGHVAVSAVAGGATTWRFHAPSGEALGAAEVLTLVPQPDGFQALRVSPGATEDAPVVEHLASGPGGAVGASALVSGTRRARRCSRGRSRPTRRAAPRSCSGP